MNRLKQSSRPWSEDPAAKMLVDEYADLAKAVREAMTATGEVWLQPALVTGALGLISFGVINNSDKHVEAWLAWLIAFAVAALLTIHSLRRVAEFHAMGGHKRAIEVTLHSLSRTHSRKSPLVWESRLVFEKRFYAARRVANGVNATVLALIGGCALWLGVASQGWHSWAVLGVAVLAVSVVCQWALVTVVGDEAYSSSLEAYRNRLGISIDPDSGRAPQTPLRRLAKTIAGFLDPIMRFVK